MSKRLNMAVLVSGDHVPCIKMYSMITTVYYSQCVVVLCQWLVPGTTVSSTCSSNSSLFFISAEKTHHLILSYYFVFTLVTTAVRTSITSTTSLVEEVLLLAEYATSSHRLCYFEEIY